MKKSVIIALSTALAAPAFAGGKQDEPIVEPEVVAPEPAPAAYDWTGPYAGSTLGLGRVTSSGAASNQTAFGAAPHAGYNMDMGDWIIGAEVEVTPGALVDLSAGGRDIGTSGRVKLRAGPKLGADRRTFAFGTLGAAHVRSDSNAGSHSDTGWLALGCRTRSRTTCSPPGSCCIIASAMRAARIPTRTRPPRRPGCRSGSDPLIGRRGRRPSPALVDPRSQAAEYARLA